MRTDILSIPMSSNDANARTVGDYLRRLLLELLTERDGFTGKRPFGNSGWFSGDLVAALVRAGVVDGTLDAEGCVIRCDKAAALILLTEAINKLFEACLMPEPDHERAGRG